MRQSEQLDTRLVLAADDRVAAGLLIQRLPVQGQGNLAGQGGGTLDEGRGDLDEDFHRIAILAASLKSQELLTLDADTLLHRLFWQENLRRFEPLQGENGPRFACTCSRERVADMLRSLGVAEIESILAERPEVEVGCDFCGAQHRFDPIDAARLFRADVTQPPVGDAAH